jgi:hypothetical protein
VRIGVLFALAAMTLSTVAGLLQSDATMHTSRGRPLVVQTRYLVGLGVDGLGWLCTVVALRNLWGSRTRMPPGTCRLGCALVLVDQASKDRLASDPLLGKVRDGMIGAWREKPKRSMWPPAVVVGAVFGEDGPQVPFAEDQDAVGEFGSGGQDEAFGVAVRPGTSGWDLDGVDAAAGKDGVEGGGELAGAVGDEEPEAGGAVAEIHEQVAERLRCPTTVEYQSATSPQRASEQPRPTPIV